MEIETKSNFIVFEKKEIFLKTTGSFRTKEKIEGKF